MSSSLSPALKSTLEVAEDTIPHINTTRYACGASFEQLRLIFRVSAECSLAIGITILCYDTLLRFGDEVRGGSRIQSGLLVLTRVWLIGAIGMGFAVECTKISPLFRKSEYLSVWTFLKYTCRTEISHFSFSF